MGREQSDVVAMDLRMIKHNFHKGLGARSHHNSSAATLTWQLTGGLATDMATPGTADFASGPSAGTKGAGRDGGRLIPPLPPERIVYTYARVTIWSRRQ